MNNDSGIICFQHCNGINIYCILIPTVCPVCKKCLQNLSSIPVRVPYPFIRAPQQSCSVVVKPTHGDFLNNYNLMDDLHIGITTSRGKVLSYDWNGISEDTHNWEECLVVFQLDEHYWRTNWDDVLKGIIQNDCWNSARYNEVKHNCLSFVMDFFKQFNSSRNLAPLIETREDFAKLYIAPITVKAYKYILLHRKIIDNGFYIYNQPSKEILNI